MCGSCGVKIIAAQDLEAGVAGIPLAGVMTDSFPALLSWGFCINADKVIAAFKAKTGLDITEEHLVKLVQIHANGNDVKIYKTNFLDLIRSVKFTQAERDNASCKVKLTR